MRADDYRALDTEQLVRLLRRSDDRMAQIEEHRMPPMIRERELEIGSALRAALQERRVL